MHTDWKALTEKRQKKSSLYSHPCESVFICGSLFLAKDALVSFKRTIGHPRCAVVLTHAANTVVAQFCRERSVPENLQNAFCQTIRIIRLDQETTRRSLDDLRKRSASRLDHRH